MSKDSTKPALLRRTYHHDRNRVFDAFASADALEQWFSPKPEIATEVVEFDFRIGGRYRITFTLPDGSRSSVFGQFSQIERPVRLCFTWSWEKPDPHAGIETFVKVDFAGEAATTDVVVSHERLTHEEVRKRHSNGWIGTLDRLGTWLKETPVKSTLGKAS